MYGQPLFSGHNEPNDRSADGLGTEVTVGHRFSK